MDIREALEAALAEVTAAIPDAKAEAEKAARHVAELLDEERGLQLALARRTAPAVDSSTTTTSTTRTVGIDTILGAPPPEPEASTEPTAPEVAPAEPHSDWASLNHMDAVLRALTEANRPLSPKDIVRALRAAGRSDTNDQVRAALAALKRHRRVSLIGRAQWVAIADVGVSAGLNALTTAARLSRLDEAQTFQPLGSNGPASIPTDAGGGERAS